MPPTIFHKKADPKHLQFVFECLDHFHPLSSDLKAEFTARCFEVEVRKDEYLLRKGSHSYYIYFIIEGILTGRAGTNTCEITSFISVKGEFVSAIEGLYGSASATEDIKAEEDAILLGLHVVDVECFTSRYPEMNIIMKKVMQLYYQMAHHRSIFFRIGTATDKYAFFLSAYPHHAELIRLDVAASFLNIKIDTLKKIVNLNSKKEDTLTLTKKEVESYMESEKPFRQKKLMLTQLAAKLNMNSHQLSHLLNVYFNQNFNEFINTHRMKYVLEQLAVNGSLVQYSLDGLGFEAGFSSRSSFFSQFKKHTGLAPYRYLKLKD
ncbi:MAG: helix-turn-helix domain-containing protein [Candidatus Pedobacter colombiensis]|uniref:Helix-turn-helix domain-containing protein n=1 Tax=Candidatus Pedobacter colombiensis TaxID=3121371 RepID=A0AAJ5WBL8_9SPHI|nr:helix-turn-helix domain-containing protein [Pedobacter sp.]WEK20474.1 MAG: helix-turn-helix domain-containing protein [Pedobacter sp.]